MSDQTFVIVGASLAGAKAAEELRERGFDGRVVLIGTEQELPYERPPLSKDYLRGESERDDMRVHDRGLLPGSGDRSAAGHDCDGDRSGRWTHELAGAPPACSFDVLLLATGSSPRRLAAARARSSTGSTTCARSADSDAIRARIEQRRPCGRRRRRLDRLGGRRQRAPERTRCDADRPSCRCRMRRSSAASSASSTGTSTPATASSCLLGDGVAAFEGDGSVSRVRTTSGRHVECDFVVVGAGATPNVELGQRAGLETDNGILVDPRLQTSARTCSPPATSPTPGTRSTTGGSASSTGPTRSIRGRRPPVRCSATQGPTTSFRTSSPTSTTSAWSTRGSRPGR